MRFFRQSAKVKNVVKNPQAEIAENFIRIVTMNKGFEIDAMAKRIATCPTHMDNCLQAMQKAEVDVADKGIKDKIEKVVKEFKTAQSARASEGCANTFDLHAQKMAKDIYHALRAPPSSKNLEGRDEDDANIGNSLVTLIKLAKEYLKKDVPDLNGQNDYFKTQLEFVTAEKKGRELYTFMSGGNPFSPASKPPPEISPGELISMPLAIPGNEASNTGHSIRMLIRCEQPGVLTVSVCDANNNRMTYVDEEVLKKIQNCYPLCCVKSNNIEIAAQPETHNKLALFFKFFLPERMMAMFVNGPKPKPDVRDNTGYLGIENELEQTTTDIHYIKEDIKTFFSWFRRKSGDVFRDQYFRSQNVGNCTYASRAAVERLLLGSKDTSELIEMNDAAIMSMAIDSKKDFGEMNSSSGSMANALADINASLKKVTQPNYYSKSSPKTAVAEKTPVDLVKEKINALKYNHIGVMKVPKSKKNEDFDATAKVCLEKLQGCYNKYSSGEQEGEQVKKIAREIIGQLDHTKNRDDAASFLKGYTSDLSQLLGGPPYSKVRLSGDSNEVSRSRMEGLANEAGNSLASVKKLLHVLKGLSSKQVAKIVREIMSLEEVGTNFKFQEHAAVLWEKPAVKTLVTQYFPGVDLNVVRTTVNSSLAEVEESRKQLLEKYEHANDMYESFDQNIQKQIEKVDQLQKDSRNKLGFTMTGPTLFKKYKKILGELKGRDVSINTISSYVRQTAHCLEKLYKMDGEGKRDLMIAHLKKSVAGLEDIKSAHPERVRFEAFDKFCNDVLTCANNPNYNAEDFNQVAKTVHAVTEKFNEISKGSSIDSVEQTCQEAQNAMPRQTAAPAPAPTESSTPPSCRP